MHIAMKAVLASVLLSLLCCASATAQQAVLPDEYVAPNSTPIELAHSLQPVNFRQYVISNEHEGHIFVVEGEAQNNSAQPVGGVMVQVALYDKTDAVVAQQDRLCGNTLSLFQLQVQSRQELIDALASQVGIDLNNTYIKPGETTPFMMVFFDPPANVEQYRITVMRAEPASR